MVVGIGVDSIEISRVLHACEKKHFIERIFTQNEQAQFDKSMRRAASDFAGKEAVVKMFGTGFDGIDADEIAILRAENGAPYVRLQDTARQKAEEKGVTEIQITLTDSRELATAFVLCGK